MNSEVNIKYVLGLEEQADKTPQIVKIDIPQSSDIIEELEAMQENPNKNLYDMSSYFYHYVNPIEDCYNYCLPEEYYKSYLNEQVSSAPKEIPYWEYRKTETEIRTTWERRLYKKEELSQQELEQKWKEYVHKVEYSDKKIYFSKAKKYILCQNLNMAISEAESNLNIKIYSHDIVGFNHIIYDIDDDVKVRVDTNFGYGSASSYFFLTIKYKDIILIPYSDLVHFYYASMKSLIAHTKSYSCNRDSWRELMEYVSNFVNKSRHNPESFVRDYVLNEIHIMMEGLREIINNPKEALEQISTIYQGNVRLSTLRPFTKNEFQLYETTKEEITSVFKIEKISGALHFIENLKSLKVLCSEVDSVIDEIIELNKSVAPEIHSILESIDVSIQPIQEEIDNLNKELDKKITEQERLENRLEYILSYWKQRSDEAKKKREERFKRQYPRYEIVAKEISDLNDKIFPLKKYVESRKKLRKRLTDCNDIMNSYIQ